MTRDFVEVNPATSPNPRPKINTFQSLDQDSNVVESQAIVPVDPDTGDPIALATQDTQLDVLAAVRALDTGVFSGLFSGTNGESADLEPGMPVAQPTSSLRFARNDTGSSLALVIGLVVVGAAATLPTRATAQGALTLPTARWDAVTGGSGGLIPGARYYLDSAPGMLTTTPPTTPGQYLTVVGSAISAVTMLVNPEPPILL